MTRVLKCLERLLRCLYGVQRTPTATGSEYMKFMFTIHAAMQSVTSGRRPRAAARISNMQGENAAKQAETCCFDSKQEEQARGPCQAP